MIPFSLGLSNPKKDAEKCFQDADSNAVFLTLSKSFMICPFSWTFSMTGGALSKSTRHHKTHPKSSNTIIFSVPKLSPPVPSHPCRAKLRGNAASPRRLGRGGQALHRRRPTRGRVRCQGMGAEGWSFAGAVLLSQGGFITGKLRKLLVFTTWFAENIP